MADKKRRETQPPVPEYGPGPEGGYTDWEETQREIEERRWEEEQDFPEDFYDPDSEVEIPE